MIAPLSRLSSRHTVRVRVLVPPSPHRYRAYTASLSPSIRFAPRRTMSTTRDVSTQSDISKAAMDKDGSFKRKDSQFRNVIEKGGRFPPEKGAVFAHPRSSLGGGLESG